MSVGVSSVSRCVLCQSVRVSYVDASDLIVDVSDVSAPYGAD